MRGRNPKFHFTTFAEGLSSSTSVFHWLNDAIGWILIMNAAGTVIYIRRTTDGGRTWSTNTQVAGAARTIGAVFSVIYFLDANNGVIVAKGASTTYFCYKSIDGGITWTQTTAFPATNLPSAVTGVTMFDANNWSVIGSSGTSGTGRFSFSTDAGVTWSAWTLLEAGCQSNNCLLKLSSTVAICTGFPSGASKVYRTTDTGHTWAPVKSYVPNTEANVSFHTCSFDNNTIYACGRRGSSSNTGVANPFVIKSTDAGVTWGIPVYPTTQLIGIGECVSFKDNYNGFLINYSNDKGSSRLFKTTDGGVTWKYYGLLDPGLQYYWVTAMRYTNTGLYLLGYTFPRNIIAFAKCINIKP